jgi:UDP-N-acetylglucosamine--N-acetylmuramyl-(pentapeptide) pyrophosphoryl-undecaprenol N-acetylglucosamine transferase
MIVLFAAGSGGHIEPAILLKQRLEKLGKSADLLVGNYYPKVPHTKILKIPRRKIMALLYFPLLFVQIIRYFLLNRPKIIVGFGGFQSLPVLLIFKLLGCKVAVYEPNLIIGRANKFVLPFVDMIFLIWEDTIVTIPERYRKKTIFVRPLVSETVGNSIHDEKFNIVVLGGSQGSEYLNNLVIKLLKNFKQPQEIKINLITGCKFYFRVIEQLSQLGTDVEYNVQDFCNDMSKYYLNGDFFITRAGAQTIMELIFHCRPALLIPYPYAGAHQLRNARHLLYKRCCLVISQEKASWEIVGNVILAVNRNQTPLDRMSKNLNKLRQKLFNNPGMEEVIVSRLS